MKTTLLIGSMIPLMPMALAAGNQHADLGHSIVRAQAGSVMTNGEVRNVDKGAGRIMLKHGEIRNLGMPAMSMVFQVRDPAMLDKVRRGDKVRFHAENANGALVVTQIEVAN